METHEPETSCGVETLLTHSVPLSSLQHQRVVTCPGCGTVNPADAVFCINHECHKALGEFRYVLEELRTHRSRFEQLADRVTHFTGHPHFVTIHLAWFSVWILANSGMLAFFHTFDEYPYGLLGIILSIEAILISSFVLISQNRQSTYAELRAELDYEVTIQTYRKIEALEERLEALAAALAPAVPESERNRADT